MTPLREVRSLGQAAAMLKDRRLHLLVGFSLLLGSIYLTIAFTSFLFSGRADQSIVAALGMAAASRHRSRSTKPPICGASSVTGLG